MAFQAIFELIVLSRITVGPLVASDEARAAELELSLLERLFQRELYSKFSTLNGPSYAKPKQTPSPRLPPYTHLVKVRCICLLHCLV